MSSSVAYQRLNTRSPPVSTSVQDEDDEDLAARFREPTPPLWQRIALILFVIFLHVLAWKLFPVGTVPVEDKDTSYIYILGQ